MEVPLVAGTAKVTSTYYHVNGGVVSGSRGRPTFVVAAARTPFGRRGRSLAAVHPVDLLGAALLAVLERSGVPAGEVQRVITGCVEKTGEQGFNVGRTAWLAAGLPIGVACSTVDAQCGSSQEALSTAHALVAAGHAEVVLAAGVESMSRVPMATTFTAGPGDPVPASYLSRWPFPDQFEAAERMAVDWGISRDACDALAVRSNTRALAAPSSELLMLAELSADENRRETTAAGVAALPSLLPAGVHTGATASKVADGASAVVIASEAAVARLELRPLARVVRSVLVGVSPEAMLSGPMAATRRLLEEEALSVADVDHFEVNEAFAAVVLAWAAELKVDLEQVNPSGGALAHGHPLGATGTGLVAKAVHHLLESGGRRALVTMCCGGGLGTGTLLERT